MSNIISTWIYCEPPGEESHYAQVSGLSSTSKFQNVYWRSVVVFFASSIRFNKSSEHVLYTPNEDLPVVDGVDLAILFKKLGVNVVQIPLTYLPPVGYHGSWRNQFYIFDIIKYLSNSSFDSVVVLDSDCIFIKPISPLYEDIQKYNILTFDCGFGADEQCNGLSPIQAEEVYRELGLTMTAPTYYGGEFFACNKNAILKLAADIDPVWNFCLNRFSAGLSKFNEEAHFLSYLYHKNDIKSGTANRYISRIWTGYGYRLIPSNVNDLTIWHLPAEKRWGIKRLFPYAVDQSSKFWRLDDIQYRNLIASFCGIPNPNVKKLILDFSDKFSENFLR